MHKGVGMMKRQSNNITVWTMIRRVLPQVASACPPIFIAIAVLFALDGFCIAAGTFFTQFLFDKVANLAMSKATLMEAILALLMLFGMELFKQLVNGLGGFFGETNFLRVKRSLTNRVNLKMAKLDPICFENPETLDHINKCYEGIRFSIHFIDSITDTVTFYIPYFIFMGAYLFSLKPVLALSLLLIFLPTIFTQIINSKIFAKLEDASAPLRRKNEYYKKCLTGREYVKETRVLGACPYFIKLFKESLVQMNKLKWQADVKSSLLELSTKLVSLAGYLGILFMLFNSLMNKEISVGAFAAVFASIGKMFELMEEIICGRLARCSKNFGKVENYLRFLDLPERFNDENNNGTKNVCKSVNTNKNNYSEEKDFICRNNFTINSNKKNVNTFSNEGDIVLENVTFSYPLSNKNAVDNVTLEIKKGETIAIVGENGSGKSTLVRLITGLYLPTKGSILHNNISTKDIPSTELFYGISGVFQKYQRYQLTLKDNITISDISKDIQCEPIDSNEIIYENTSIEAVRKAAIQGGVELNRDVFPNGYDTMLSREFDGVDLSGGQWQKVAIARGFYRDNNLIILDEPTAAIDPVEETKIYERFSKIAKGKTAIVVTHRLGSVKFADRIVVMDKGKVQGVGTHEQLLGTCPLYAKMWESQAKYYVTI